MKSKLPSDRDTWSCQTGLISLIIDYNQSLLFFLRESKANKPRVRAKIASHEDKQRVEGTEKWGREEKRRVEGT